MATQFIIALRECGGGKAPHGPVYFKLFQHPLNTHTMCANVLIPGSMRKMYQLPTKISHCVFVEYHTG
jgi:hypothetical protein